MCKKAAEIRKTLRIQHGRRIEAEADFFLDQSVGSCSQSVTAMSQSDTPTRFDLFQPTFATFVYSSILIVSPYNVFGEQIES